MIATAMIATKGMLARRGDEHAGDGATIILPIRQDGTIGSLFRDYPRHSEAGMVGAR
jgi:hypothetical protein